MLCMREAHVVYLQWRTPGQDVLPVLRLRVVFEEPVARVHGMGMRRRPIFDTKPRCDIMRRHIAPQLRECAGVEHILPKLVLSTLLQ